jgi:tripartite-type tricarboxylate transporter receptor subunit TctC
MRTMSRAAVLAAALICANLACVVGTRAQDYPFRPITMIVPFPAGGPTDTLGRILSERMRVSLGQTIVIENVTGAGSTIGVARAAQAAADGYALALGNWTSFVGSGALYRTSYELLKDFEPVSLLTFAPMLIVGKNELPATDAKELIAWLKANPDKASAATVGAGSAAHVCGLYFQTRPRLASSSCRIAAAHRQCRTWSAGRST